MKYDVVGLDVYGNQQEGFEINDLYRLCELEIDEESTNEHLIECLIEDGILNEKARKRARVEWLEYEFIEIFDNDSGRPELQLRKSY